MRLPPTACVGRQQHPVDESGRSPYAEICFATRATAYSANGVLRREKGEERKKKKREKNLWSGNGFSAGTRGTETLTDASVAAHSDADNSPAGPAVPFSFFFLPAAAPTSSQPIAQAGHPVFGSLDVAGLRAAPRLLARFCFPLFSGFSGRAARRPLVRAAQQVADYKNHSSARGRDGGKNAGEKKKKRKKDALARLRPRNGHARERERVREREGKEE